jgi:hypothetical protein
MFKYILILVALVLWSFLAYINTDVMRENLFFALIIITFLLVIKHAEKENL